MQGRRDGHQVDPIWADSLRLGGPQERNHIYEAETAVEIHNTK